MHLHFTYNLKNIWHESFESVFAKFFYSLYHQLYILSNKYIDKLLQTMHQLHVTDKYIQSLSIFS